MKLLLRVVALALFAMPALAFAAEPQLGVEQKLRRGLYAETDLGTFFDFRLSDPFTTSNAQAYLQLGLGYDITDRFSVALEFGLGASSGVCLGDIATSGECGVVTGAGVIATGPDGAREILPDNFSNSFYQLHVSYRAPLSDRVAIVPGVVLGYQRLDPAPVAQDEDITQLVSDGFMFGGNVSIEYATHLDHFFIALDLEPRFLVGPNLLSMSIFPRVKYTF